MVIHPEEQRSLAWLCKRAGIVTASEFGNLLTPELKMRQGQTVSTYLCRKLAEAWIGPLPGFNVLDMEFGRILEEEAIPFFTLETGIDVRRVGLITTDDGRIGCSPDGLIGDDCGLEIKCPSPATHVNYLLNGSIPKDYLPQVHGGMFVTGFKRWKFMSYCRSFPPLILEVSTTPQIQDTIRTALDVFLKVFDESYALLVEKNGGPPKKAQPEAPQAEEEFHDPFV